MEYAKVLLTSLSLKIIPIYYLAAVLNGIFIEYYCDYCDSKTYPWVYFLRIEPFVMPFASSLCVILSGLMCEKTMEQTVLSPCKKIRVAVLRHN